jgi:hypothetical protein
VHCAADACDTQLFALLASPCTAGVSSADFLFPKSTNKQVCFCSCSAGAAIVSSARTIKAGGKGSSSSRSRGSTEVQPEWVPLLPEARSVLLAALVHEHEGSPLQGIQHAVQLLSTAAGQAGTAWVEQQQGKTGKQQKQQQSKASSSKQAAKSTASSSSSDSASADYTPLLTLPVLKALLASCVDAVTDEQSEVADEAAAAAAGNAIADLMSQLLGCNLLQLLDHQQQQQAPAASPLPALVLPDAEAWTLLVRLFGAAGRYKWVAGLVSAAMKGQLPLAQPSTAAAAAAAGGPSRWSAGDLQCVLAAAAAVWLSVRCPGLVLAMLDALAAAGGRWLDNAQLARAVDAATCTEVSGGLQTCCLCDVALFVYLELPSHTKCICMLSAQHMIS